LTRPFGRTVCTHHAMWVNHTEIRCQTFATRSTAEPAIMGPGQEAWVGRLEQERDNLRAALGWLREEGEAERGLRLTGALGRFWWFRGYFSEGRAQLGEFLELAGAASGRTVARAKAFLTLGVLIYRSAD
jgi:predicted ATPase